MFIQTRQIMTEVATDKELTSLFSTYGLLTSKRILERFKIYLENDELIAAFKNPRSIYFLLLRVPLKNIFNGIILQQAHDYQVYAQKIFVDYLLSGEQNKPPESPGANTREDLEAARKQLMEIGENFNKEEEIHQQLIKQSQASLIKLTDTLRNTFQEIASKFTQILKQEQIIKDDKLIARSIRMAIIHYDQIDDQTLAVSSAFWNEISKVLGVELNNEVRQKMAEVMKSVGDPRNDLEDILINFLEKTSDTFVSLRSYRSQFYNLILSTTELIQLLQDYHVDKEKDEENRASLHFDAHIGGD